MNRYVYTLALSAAACMTQIWLVAQPQLSRLSPKSSALAHDALYGGLASIEMIGMFFVYVVVAISTHAIPMLFVAKVHGDIEARGPARLRNALGIRGALSLSLFGTLMLLAIANHFVFPASQALPDIDLLFIQPASPLLLVGLPLLYAGAVIYWLVRFSSRRLRILLGTFSLGALTALAASSAGKSQPPRSYTSPDIIIIGVDSLRPDHLTNLGFHGTTRTPSIDRFVGESVLFERTYTPQARTFVAYMSLLTGQYPTRHGARENLYPRTMFSTGPSVAHRLKRHGYATLFAMDEARFANFDHSFGFDSVVSPPAGTIDFVVGGFLDTVGTNLLQLIPGAGPTLLPHLAGNRAAASIYRPELHSQKLRHAIDAIDPSQPLLLVSHFCMAHSPYSLDATLHDVPDAPFGDSPSNYRAALSVADGQFSSLIGDLRGRGRLDNAIVILLSDHGEALGMEKDRWRLSSADGRITNTNYYGHGSPALDEAQSRVLLSVQRFNEGRPAWTPRRVSEVASLVDVIPTLLHVANMPYENKDFDGIALLNPKGLPMAPSSRAVFLESGISGISLQKAQVDPGDVANEFNYLYGVTADQRFELLPNELPEQLRQKQRAMILGRYGLSSWPSVRDDQNDCWLLVNLESRKATCLPLDSRNPIVGGYKPLLCTHFEDDSEFFKRWCQPPNRPVPSKLG